MTSLRSERAHFRLEILRSPERPSFSSALGFVVGYLLPKSPWECYFGALNPGAPASLWLPAYILRNDINIMIWYKL